MKKIYRKRTLLTKKELIFTVFFVLLMATVMLAGAITVETENQQQEVTGKVTRAGGQVLQRVTVLNPLSIDRFGMTVTME